MNSEKLKALVESENPVTSIMLMRARITELESAIREYKQLYQAGSILNLKEEVRHTLAGVGALVSTRAKLFSMVGE